MRLFFWLHWLLNFIFMIIQCSMKNSGLMHDDFNSFFEGSFLRVWMAKFPACLELLSSATVFSSCSVAEHWQLINFKCSKLFLNLVICRVFSRWLFFQFLYYHLMRFLKIKDIWRIQVPPKDCAELYKSGRRISGVYTIDPDDSGAFSVYCDNPTAGGG